MSYRTITLASCLFVVACGGAPPPAAGAPPSPTPDPGATGHGEEKPDSGPASAASLPPLRGTDQARSGSPDKDDSKPIHQAVVTPPEPLSGKLTQADIGRILESNGDVFGDCYTLGAGGKTKDFKGVVTVKATIGPSGTVNQVDVTKSTANNPKVDACVREAFKKIKFPHPRDGATSVITFPISFNGVEQIQ